MADRTIKLVSSDADAAEALKEAAKTNILKQIAGMEFSTADDAFDAALAILKIEEADNCGRSGD